MTSVFRPLALSSVLAAALLTVPAAAVQQASTAEDPSGTRTHLQYKLLATSKTSTMEEELNATAGMGFRFRDVMGGETSFGGSEVVIVMSRSTGEDDPARYEYRLLATSKTSTMQQELQEAGDAGFEAVGQTVFQSAFGGDEVVMILERDRQREPESYEYLLLATKRTGTLEKELFEAGEMGYDIVGLTVSKTTFGGNEIVSILRRKRDD